MRTNFSQDEFKFVIGSLYNLVRFIKTASGHNQKILHASILKNIAKRFLYPEEETEGEAATSAAVNASLLSKLKQPSGENWSIVFDNIPRVISLVDEVDKVNLWDPRAVRKPFTQEEILRGMHVDLFDTFSEVQSRELASKAASVRNTTFIEKKRKNHHINYNRLIKHKLVPFHERSRHERISHIWIPGTTVFLCN